MSEKWTFDKPFHSTDEEAGYWNGGDTYIRGSYVESPEVTAAKNALNAQMAQKPNAYQSQWQQQLSDTINKITNRDEFSYDVNGDALYQQYKDKFIKQGKMASADVMGHAAAMTGGYGNSYAATVGNQAYQAHLNNLNDVIPELYQMAYDRYKQEGQDLYNQYSLFADRDNTDYGRYRDTVGDWQTDRNFLANRFDTERNFDYGVFNDAENAAQSQWNADYANAWDRYTYDSDLAYTDYRNSIADAQRQAELDAATSGGGSGGGGNGGGGNNGLSPTEFNAIIENASIYAENGKGSLSNYLNGCVNRNWISPDEAADILEQYFPTGYLPENPKAAKGGNNEYRVGNMVNMLN